MRIETHLRENKLETTDFNITGVNCIFLFLTSSLKMYHIVAIWRKGPNLYLSNLYHSNKGPWPFPSFIHKLSSGVFRRYDDSEYGRLLFMVNHSLKWTRCQLNGIWNECYIFSPTFRTLKNNYFFNGPLTQVIVQHKTLTSGQRWTKFAHLINIGFEIWIQRFGCKQLVEIIKAVCNIQIHPVVSKTA